MFQFSNKLRFLKSKITIWNKEVFKNVFREKARIENDLGIILDHVMSFEIDAEVAKKQKYIQCYWEILCAREEIY